MTQTELGRIRQNLRDFVTFGGFKRDLVVIRALTY